jgi:PKD domain/Galactose oxidase, central domain
MPGAGRGRSAGVGGPVAVVLLVLLLAPELSTPSEASAPTGPHGMIGPRGTGDAHSSPPPTVGVGATPALSGVGPVAWVNVSSPPGMAPRSGAMMAYDPDTQESVLFGGNDQLADTWVWSGGRWTELCSGTAGLPTCAVQPSGRSFGAFAYDSRDHEFVLYGGFQGSFWLDDTWTFSNATWHDVYSQTGLFETYPARVDDREAQTMLLFGETGATWAFSAVNWNELHPATAPLGHAGFSRVYDASAREAVLFGGVIAGATEDLNTTWAFSNGTWRQLGEASAPSPRRAAQLVYDARVGYAFLFGGYSTTGGVGHNDTWLFENGTWRNVTAFFPDAPPATVWAAAVFDVALDVSILVFGQVPGGGELRTDTWYMVDPFATAPATTDLDVPAGHSITVWLNASGGVPPYAYSYTGGPPGCPTPNASAYTCRPTEAGDYALNATVSDGGWGAFSATFQLQIGVELVVSASASPNPADVGVPVQFVAVVDSGTAPFQFDWTFPGAPTQSGPAVSQSFAESGTVDTVVAVTDALGVRANRTVPVTIAPLAVAAVAANRTVTDVGIPVQLTATLTQGSGLARVDWTYGDGTSGVGSSVDHTYLVAGNYSVTAVVHDLGGGVASAHDTVRVNPRLEVTLVLPPAAIVPDQGVVLAVAVSGGTAPDTVDWSLSDGTVATTLAFSHAFASPGNYSVRAEVRDAVGAWANLSGVVRVLSTFVPVVNPSAPSIPTPWWVSAGIGWSLGGLALALLLDAAAVSYWITVHPRTTRHDGTAGAHRPPTPPT